MSENDDMARVNPIPVGSILFLVVLVFFMLAYTTRDTDTSSTEPFQHSSAIAKSEKGDRWQAKSNGQEFCQNNVTAIVMRCDYFADSGWFFRRIYLAGDVGEIVITDANRTPFDDFTIIGMKVDILWQEEDEYVLITQ